MFNSRFIYFLMLILCISGCKKEEISFPAEPKIDVISVSPSSPAQYTDDVIINIHYEDGDGDLGENNDQIKNCFVTDNRNGVTYEYRIKQLAPSNATIPIEGTLNINIGGQVLTDNSNSQNATYTIYVMDRAGHHSNSVTTGVISIRR